MTAPLPCCDLRREYRRGVATHVAGNYVGALGIFRRLAQLGFAPAQFMLGSMCHNGEGVEEDPGAALIQYSMAADQEEPRAAYILGCMHCMGDGVEEDPKQGARWFRLSAEWGYAPAQFSLGTMYASGTDVPRDSREAMKWFLLAAVRGHQQALLDLKAVAAAVKKGQPPSGTCNGRERNERI